MCTNENAEQTNLQHLPVTAQHLVKSFELVLILSVLCWKHSRIQISYKPLVQACDDFKILIQTSRGEQLNFKFVFIQFRLMK